MANERRAAKEAYLAALKLQVTADKLSSRTDNLQPNYNGVRAPVQASERDRILDERHSEFLRKQDRTLHRAAEEPYQPVDEQYRNQIDISYRNGANIKSHQGIDSNVGWESRKPQQDFDPGAWKREGYPSEYTYAQSSGALNIPSSKDKNTHEYSYDRLSESANRRDYTDQGMDYEGPAGGSYSAPAAQVREQAQGLSYSSHRDYAPQQQKGTELPANDNLLYKQVRGGISAIGNDNDKDRDKLAKKAKQAEYAQYLESQVQAREQRDNAGKRGQYTKSSVNGPSYEGLGLQNMGIVSEDKSAKRSKQAEYARDLQRQQQQQQQQRVHQDEPHRSQRSDRQQQQQEREEQQYDDRRLSHNDYQQQTQSEKNRNMYGNGNGMRVEQRRNASPQKERARNSQYDDYSCSNDGSQHHDDPKYTEDQGARMVPNPVPYSVPSALGPKKEEIAAKRAKQLEYAQSLSDQQQFKQRGYNEHGAHSSDSHYHSSSTATSSSSSTAPGGYASSSNQNNRSVDEVTEKQLKRAKQAEYAQALQRQQLMQHSAASSTGVGLGGGRGPHSPGKKSHYSRERRRDPRETEGGPIRLSGQNGSGGLEDGWVIGPLGQPVRRTLEVGHRGVQKVFNQTKKEYQIDSPSYSGGWGEGEGRARGGSEGYYPEGGNDRESYSHDSPSSFSPDQRYKEGQGSGQGHGKEQGEGHGRGQRRGLGLPQGQGSGSERERGYERSASTDNNSYDSQDYRQADDEVNTYPADNGYGYGYGGAGAGGADSSGRRDKGNFKAHNIEPRTALNADVLDERKVKAKNMQAEQARALQIQMRENATRLASEKEKRGKEELLELTRLEVERVAMVNAFEREQQEGRKKADDENKKALLHQAGEKKRAKEAEELEELERNGREDRRVREEQESVRRREIAELHRERNPSRGQGVGMEGLGSGPKGSRASLFKRSPSSSPSSSPSKPLDAPSGYPKSRGRDREKDREGSREREWQAPRHQGAVSFPSSSSSPSKSTTHSHGDGNRNGLRDKNREGGVSEMEKSMRGISMKEMHTDRDRDRDRDREGNHIDDELYSSGGGHSARSGSHGQGSRSDLQRGDSYGDVSMGYQRERDKEKERERMRERERVGLGGAGGTNEGRCPSQSTPLNTFALSETKYTSRSCISLCLPSHLSVLHLLPLIYCAISPLPLPLLLKALSDPTRPLCGTMRCQW